MNLGGKFVYIHETKSHFLERMFLGHKAERFGDFIFLYSHIV